MWRICIYRFGRLGRRFQFFSIYTYYSSKIESAHQSAETSHSYFHTFYRLIVPIFFWPVSGNTTLFFCLITVSTGDSSDVYFRTTGLHSHYFVESVYFGTFGLHSHLLRAVLLGLMLQCLLLPLGHEQHYR